MKIWLKNPGRCGSHIALNYFREQHGLRPEWESKEPPSHRNRVVYHDHVPFGSATPKAQRHNRQFTGHNYDVLVILRRDRVAQAMSRFIANRSGDYTHAYYHQRGVTPKPEPWRIYLPHFEQELDRIINWESTIPQNTRIIYYEEINLRLSRLYPPTHKQKHTPPPLSMPTPWHKRDLILNYDRLYEQYGHYNSIQTL